MVVNTHYKNNLKAVMQVNKAYTDDKIQEVLDLVSDYNVNSQEVEQLSTSATAPNKDIRTTSLMVIGGNSVKYNPTFASDDTTSLVKTMPSVVYDLDVNKIYGASEVCNNLIPTNQPIVITNANRSNYFDLTPYLKNGVTYYIKCNATQTYTSTDPNYRGFVILAYDSSNNETAIKTFGNTENMNVNDNFTADLTTYVKYILTLVTGNNGHTLTLNNLILSTSDVPYEPYYSGIHNLELSGLKVEGANLLDVSSTAFANGKGLNSSGVEYNNAYMKASTFIDISNMLESGETYYLWINTGNESGLRIWQYASDNSTIKQNSTSVATAKYITFTLDANTKYIRFSSNIDETNLGIFKVLPTEFIPYIQPTTLPIDLTTIEDSGGNKLFADGSLKGVDNVADEITPYKAIKRLGMVKINTLNWTYGQSGGQYERFISDVVANAKQIIDTIKPNIFTNSIPTYKQSEYILQDLGLSIASASPRFLIRDTSITTTEELLQKYGNDYIYYELATPIEADIDFSFLKNIQGYSNGSITAQNTYDMAVPSEIRYNSIIKDTLVDSIDIDNGDGDTSSIDLTDYTIESDGWSASNTVFNYRAFREDNRHKRVGRIDLGSLNWTYNSNGDCFATQDVEDYKYSNQVVALCDKFNFISPVDSASAMLNKNNYDFSFYVSSQNLKRIYIKATEFGNDATAFKQTMLGVYLYYELATEEITPLNLPRNFYRIDTKQNGVTTFNNDNNQACHNTLRYYYKEAKSNE